MGLESAIIWPRTQMVWGILNGFGNICHAGRIQSEVRHRRPERLVAVGANWVCLKMLAKPHCSQWFCWSLSLWKIAISLGRLTQHFQTNPTFSQRCDSNHGPPSAVLSRCWLRCDQLSGFLASHSANKIDIYQTLPPVTPNTTRRWTSCFCEPGLSGAKLSAPTICRTDSSHRILERESLQLMLTFTTYQHITTVSSYHNIRHKKPIITTISDSGLDQQSYNLQWHSKVQAVMSGASALADAPRRKSPQLKISPLSAWRGKGDWTNIDITWYNQYTTGINRDTVRD